MLAFLGIAGSSWSMLLGVFSISWVVIGSSVRRAALAAVGETGG